MLRYILKRLLLLIPVLLGVMLIIFTIMAIQPGDPGRMILGENASQEAVDKLNDQLGVNQPFFVRFFNYLYNAAFRLDFGTSYRTSQPVFNDVFARAGTSFKIAFNGIFMATVVGIPLGILSAVRQYSAVDTFSRVSAMLAAAIPPFWLGMMLIFIFALKLQWLPSNGVEGWQSFILPMITLGIPYAGSQLRMTRSTMLETIRQDYVRTAKAKGVPRGVIIFRHALRNALLPIITVTATSFGGLLGGAVITESVFSMPGLGTLIVTGIRQRDTPSVLAATIFLAFMFGLIMLAVDLLYAFVDPRIKAQYSR
ncbi:MAG: ABC transporter permease [Clostridiaceae bacterium]|nr:ABC transporter permease [Clostridiaceae bacterium]